jgi:beta-barrel assembly-enhancing protease
MKLFFTLLIAVFWLGSTAQAYELPDLGEHSATILSPKEAKQLEKEFMKEVYSRLSILDDTIINNYIQNLGDKLAAHATTKNRKFHFFVVRDKSINAFAGPGGNIGIYSGTFIATHSESELAAVLAHEIAHVTQHHIERLIERAKNAQITAIAGMLAATIIGITAGGSGNMATGAAMASMGGMGQHMINFTKDKEIEADNISMKILYDSGFDPASAPNFFERIQRITHNYHNSAPTFLSTHPATNDRIAESKNRANLYPKKTTNSQDTYNLLHARMRFLTFRSPSNAVRYFQKQLASKQHNNSKALHYGYTLALYKNRQLTQATKIITTLQKKYPGEVLLQLAAAQIAEANKQPQKAINILKQVLTNHPDYYPLFIQYGQTLITAKHSQEARDFLKSKIIKYSDNADLYLLLARAYAQNNQKTEAYQAKAKAYEIGGHNQHAIVLLQQALKAPKLSTIEQSIIRAKIKRLN